MDGLISVGVSVLSAHLKNAGHKVELYDTTFFDTGKATGDSYREQMGQVIPVDLSKENLSERIMDETNGWGVDRFFECSGAVKAYEAIFSCCAPGAHVVLIGNNAEPVPMNWAILFSKGLEYQTVHRYSHQYEPSLRLLESGKIDVKPMITHTFKFEESVEAFERAAEHRPTDVKLQIKIDEDK